MISCTTTLSGIPPNKHMVIIKHYSLECKENSVFFVKSREISHCPYCEGSFKVAGSRKRVLFRQDGTADRLMIRRLQCMECRRISHELPDLVVPYKRYESDVISDALDESADPEDSCCPAELSTIQKWKLWFFLLSGYFEASVRALMEFMDIKAFIRLPLYPLSQQADGWLKILVRNLVNSGRWRQTRSA